MTPIKLGCLLLLCVGSAAIVGGLYWHSVLYPPCCDAEDYVKMALSMRNNGFFHAMYLPGLRTYGYPLFLSLTLPHQIIAQWALYVASTLVLFFSIRPFNERAAWCAAAGLLLNPFTLNYVSITLSEGLAVSMFIAISAVVVCLASRKFKNPRDEILLFLVGGLLTGYAAEIRPALVAVLIAWVLFTLTHAFQHRRYVAPLVGSSLGLAATVGVQIAYNILVFDQFAFFQTADILGLFQTGAGLAYLKYATTLSGGKPQMLYPVTWLDAADIAKNGARLYFTNPVGTIPIALAHIFNSIDNDYFFTYIYDKKPWYGVALNGLNHTILFLAGVSFFTNLRWLKTPALIAVVLFFSSVVALVFAENAITIVETRFGLLVYAIAAPVALLGLPRIASLSRQTQVGILGLGVIYVATALWLSSIMMQLANA